MTDKPITIDEVAKRLRLAINARDLLALRALYSSDMASAFTADQEKAFIEGVLSNGSVDAATRSDGGDLHAQYDLFTKGAGKKKEMRLDLHVDEEMKIIGYTIRPAEVEKPLATSPSSISLGLPFKGEWFVFWGGDTRALNAHVDEQSQRRAADLCKVDSQGSTHSGDGKKNTDYLVYGAEVRAVADGTVTLVVDGVPDNDPGATNRTHVGGNEIIIMHTDGVYSLYAHLQRDKHRVKRGAKVKKGDVLGLVGNSGNSSEPHLHFQLQDGPLLYKSWGIEAIFPQVQVKRGDATSFTMMSDYKFLKGDRIAPAK